MVSLSLRHMRGADTSQRHVWWLQYRCNVHAAGSGPALVRQFVEYLFDLTKEREQAMLVALVVTFLVKDAISRADFLSAMERFSKQLEDLRWAACQ